MYWEGKRKTGKHFGLTVLYQILGTRGPNALK